MANETVRRLRIKVSIEGEVAGPDGSLLPVNIQREYNFQDGTGQNQVGAVWQDLDGSLATTTTTLDLDGLTDFKGATMSDNNKVKVGAFFNDSDSGNLVVGGGDWTGPFADASDKLIVKPRGMALIIDPLDGYTVTATSADGLLLETTATVSYKGLLAFDNT
jgi:hypothetical protein